MSLFEGIPRAAGGYRCAVADPPWAFRDRGSRAAPTYRTYATPDLAQLPVSLLLAPDALLFLWCPDTHFADGLWLLDWWGLAYKHLAVWGKVRIAESVKVVPPERAGVVAEVPGGIMWRADSDDPVLRPQIGFGHYMRKAHEVALVATRGHPEILDHSVPSLILAPRGRHSEKPEALQDAAERLSPGPYLELFARRRRPGWACWGDELEER